MPVGVYRPSRTLASTQRRLYMAGGAERQRRGSPAARSRRRNGRSSPSAGRPGRTLLGCRRPCRQGKLRPSGGGPGSPSRALGGTYQGPLDSAADNLVENR